MSGNREEILENFMVVTRIKNVEEAIIWLECCNWDLMSAIKNSSPEEVKLQNDAYCKRRENGAPPETENIMDQNGAVNSRSNETSDLRVIEVYVVHGRGVHMVRVPDVVTFHCFKRLISFATDVPPCHQLITGWIQEPKSDTELLSFMPDLSYLVLKDVSNSKEEDNEKLEMEDDSLNMFNLEIFDESNDRVYNLKIPGNGTVAQVKLDTYVLTDIPIDNQSWSGWPEEALDHSEIRYLLLDKPTHSLKIRATDPSLPPPLQPVPSDDVIDVDEISDIFRLEDSDDVIVTNPSQAPLIPDCVEDEMAASVHFIDGYTKRYGQATPDFFTGTLEDAMKEAYQRPTREKRMLALYIHHDRSVLSNVFCTELLGSEATHQILSNYFVLWGWDTTNDTSRRMLLSSISRVLGSSFARTIDNIPIDSFPTLLVISTFRNQWELLNVIYGNNGISELLSLLVASIEVFTRNIEVEARQEDERIARQKIKYEQDTAYEESLEMDRAKDEAKRQKILEKSREDERVRKKVEKDNERRTAEVAAVESQLPAEPTEEQCLTYPFFTFKFRPPNGETFGRRFMSSDTLFVVFNYLFVMGYNMEDFKFITGWPRKDLTLINPQTVLGDLGIFNQETIILEAR